MVEYEHERRYSMYWIRCMVRGHVGQRFQHGHTDYGWNCYVYANVYWSRRQCLGIDDGDGDRRKRSLRRIFHAVLLF